MIFELSRIKTLRNQLGLKQKELADLAGISQSLIAKIESAKIDPSHSIAMKIFQTIEIIIKKDEKEAKEIMTKEIIFCNPEDKLKEAIKKMQIHKISQMPVMDKENILGIISETSILEKGLNSKKIKEAMDIAPPRVPTNTKISIINSMLKQYPAIIVSDGNKLSGIITKSDILKVITK